MKKPSIVSNFLETKNKFLGISKIAQAVLSADSTAYFSSEMANYYRACAEVVYIFSHEIFRFASEIKKVYLTCKIKKRNQSECRKKLKNCRRCKKLNK